MARGPGNNVSDEAGVRRTPESCVSGRAGGTAGLSGGPESAYYVRMQAEQSVTGQIVTACLVVIGNEILSGRTQDANVAYLARGLNEVGVRLREVRVIPDVAETIVETVNEVRRRYDHVFTTGGIGPTHDDITAESVARAFGVKLILHPEARRRLAERFRDRPDELNEARLRMAHVPEGATLIDNLVSTAPGFQIGNVYVLAGVPRIMQAMFDGMKHRLGGGAPVLSRSVASSLFEGTIAAGLAALQERYADIEIGSYPWYRQGRSGVDLVLRGTEAGRLDEAAAAVAAMLRGLGDAPTVEPPAGVPPGAAG
jgi:molybdenum cofactor synthesis domain-containing protein